MVWLNILAVIAAPIIAVWVGQKLQDRAEKRKDKMSLFQTIVSSRIYGWTVSSVNALNVIEIVFSDDANVCSRWKEYYKLLCIQNPSSEQLEQIKSASDELLKAMGNALGYKDKDTIEILQHPYMPVGLQEQINQQQERQNDYYSAITFFRNMAERQINSSVLAPEAENHGQLDTKPHTTV